MNYSDSVFGTYWTTARLYGACPKRISSWVFYLSSITFKILFKISSLRLDFDEFTLINEFICYYTCCYDDYSLFLTLGSVGFTGAAAAFWRDYSNWSAASVWFFLVDFSVSFLVTLTFCSICLSNSVILTYYVN